MHAYGGTRLPFRALFASPISRTYKYTLFLTWSSVARPTFSLWKLFRITLGIKFSFFASVLVLSGRYSYTMAQRASLVSYTYEPRHDQVADEPFGARKSLFMLVGVPWALLLATST